jgi:drug/metabolite transporter (DMT)-like permease
MLVFAGLMAALATAALYAVGIALQALEARKAPKEHSLRASLLVRLVKRPVWLLGTTLALAGWVAQVGALLMIPLTLVEPTLALSLVFLLGFGAWMLHEPVGRREVAAIGVVTAGLALLAWAAPARDPQHATGAGLAVAISIMAVAATVPYALARVGHSPAVLIAVGAGTAYAIDGLATKFFSDDLSAEAWTGLVLWGAVMISAAAIATLSEMSAFQLKPATQVSPIVLSITTLVPVILAPFLASESWSGDPWVKLALVTAIILVVGGATSLARSRAVGSVYEAEARRSRKDTGRKEADESRVKTASSVLTDAEGDESSVTTTRSPASGALEGSGDPASTRTAPETGLPPTARATTYSPSENDSGTR